MKILITGATGIVGSQMVKKFLKSGDELFCIVRKNKKQSSKERLCSILNISSLPSKCHVIEGDITETLCKIDKDSFKFLESKKIDLMFHCAACTKMEEKNSDDSYDINIYGTQNVINLTKKLNIDMIHYISTAYTANGLSNVYEKTKSTSEELIRISGIPYTISRISIVIGNSNTGEISDFTGYYGLVLSAYKIINKLGLNTKITLEAKDGATLNLIPIDWCVKMLALISKKEAYCDVLNVVHSKALDVESVSRLGFNSLGINKNIEFKEHVDIESKEFHTGQNIYNKVIAIFRPYTSKVINFSDTPLREFLKDEFEEAPVINEELIKKVMDYYQTVTEQKRDIAV